MINSAPVTSEPSSSKGHLRNGVRLLATRWQARVSRCSLEGPALPHRLTLALTLTAGVRRAGMVSHRRRWAGRREGLHGIALQHAPGTCGLAFPERPGRFRRRLSGGDARDAHGARHLGRRRHALDLPQRERPPRHADHRRRVQRHQIVLTHAHAPCHSRAERTGCAYQPPACRTYT